MGVHLNPFTSQLDIVDSPSGDFTDLTLNAGTAAAPSISFDGDPNTGIYSPGADQLALSTNGTGRLFVTSAGLVGIGTSSPAQDLHVLGTTGVRIQNSTDTDGQFLLTYTSNSPDFRMYDASGNVAIKLLASGNSYLNGGNVGIGTTSPALKLHAEDSSSQIIRWTRTGVGAGSLNVDASGNAVLNAHTNNTGIAFHLQESEKARIDSSGRLLVGTSTARSSLGIAAKFQVENTNYDGISLITNNTTASTCPVILMGRSKGSSLGSSTLVANNDRLAAVFFQGADGNGTNSSAASIEAYVDGTPGANDMPGRLVFSTTATGAPSPTERMRIDSAGTITFANNFSTTNYVKVPTGSNPAIRCEGTATTNTVISYLLYGGGNWRFGVGYGGTVYATSTTISSTSDIRLKENIRDIEAGLDEIMALKPRSFDWKEGKGVDIKNARGFIAHEFEEVFPDLVDEWPGEHPENEEPYKAIRQDLIPVLVKAVQEQQMIIKGLEARLTAAGI